MLNNLTLETRLIVLFSFAVILPVIPCLYIIKFWQLDLLEASTLLLAFLIPGSWVYYRCYRYMTDVIERIGLQLDALGNEEYNSWHLAGFNGGRINSLRNDFAKIGDKLANKRLEYMHNESFLIEFIAELNLPILIVDHHEQIYSSNAAFNDLISVNISSLIGQKVCAIGIDSNNEQWQQIAHSHLSQRHEIRAHVFKRSGRNYQLLVFFSIEQQLRENEKQVWQRLIRVLNHEVRNSLTPIYSMAQSLQEMKLQGPLTKQQLQTEKNILQVIENRSSQLLEFVDNYTAFSKLAPPTPKEISANDVDKQVQAIFPALQIPAHQNFTLNIDIGQLEQALINLIKNAFEASAADASVKMLWRAQNNHVHIDIIDSGKGIANLDNLFVPFYTTKSKGTGIGLILSREFIRNQGGDLTLENRQNHQGAIARITLPCG
ncbi:PAS domain-containing sensor histidine kinase [Colwelliaceae bacterium 6471]